MSAREGLSPRVRGNRVFGGQQRDVDGPIPARAGQPLDLSLGEGDYTAYPRACGATMLARMRRAIKAFGLCQRWGQKRFVFEGMRGRDTGARDH